MMDAIRGWVVGISCVSIVLAVLAALPASSGVKRISALAGGMVLILVTAASFAGADTDMADRVNLYLDSERVSSEATCEKTESLYESIIAEEVSAYILDKAEEFGIDCLAEVEIGWEDGVPIPHSVTIIGILSDEQKKLIGSMLDGDLGINAARQHYEVKTDED